MTKTGQSIQSKIAAEKCPATDVAIWWSSGWNQHQGSTFSQGGEQESSSSLSLPPSPAPSSIQLWIFGPRHTTPSLTLQYHHECTNIANITKMCLLFFIDNMSIWISNVTDAQKIVFFGLSPTSVILIVYLLYICIFVYFCICYVYFRAECA